MSDGPGGSSSSGARARVDAARARVQSARSTVPAVDTAFTVGNNDRLVGGSLLAGAIAYRMFLWLLPLALVLAAGLGFLGAADRGAPEDLADDLGLTAYVSSTVADASEQAEDGRWVLLAIGLVTLASASVSGVKTVRLVHARAWGVPPSSVRGSPAAALGFVAFALAGVGVTLGGGWARDQSPGLGIGVRVATVVAYGFLWLLASTALPRQPGTPWTALIPGALVFAAGVQLLHLVTVFYLAGKLESASELYGALGGAAAVLLWLFLIGRVVVASAVVNATLWERRAGA